MEEKLRIIVSGGGTGGHIFPAVSIANAIKELYPDTEILFIGAEGRVRRHLRAGAQRGEDHQTKEQKYFLVRIISMRNYLD